MALDPNRWTLKTQEAFNNALQLARSNSNPEVTPDHLLLALLGQEEGVVLPILQKVGKAPLTLRNDADEAVGRLPKAYGGESRLGRELQELLEQADDFRAELHDEYLSTEHLLVTLADKVGVSRDDLLTALQEVRGSHRVTEPEPRGPVPGAREVRPRSHRCGPAGQDRPGHRSRRRDPPGDPGAEPANQEQPGAHRRARRRQDGDRRGSGPSHRRRRRARGAEEQAPHRRSTWARWWPARSTAASSRSASRQCSRRSPTPRAR